MAVLTFFSVPSPWHNIYIELPLCLLGRRKQNYSDKDSLLGLLRRVAEGTGCLFWPELALSVGSGIKVGDCVGPKVEVTARVEFWVAAGASVFVWRGAITEGRSLGLRPLFLPVVAQFLTSGLIPLSSGALLLLLETTSVAAARNQFWSGKRWVSEYHKQEPVYNHIQL